jgi:hypothetical protein
MRPIVRALITSAVLLGGAVGLSACADPYYDGGYNNGGYNNGRYAYAPAPSYNNDYNYRRPGYSPPPPRYIPPPRRDRDRDRDRRRDRNRDDHRDDRRGDDNGR